MDNPRPNLHTHTIGGRTWEHEHEAGDAPHSAAVHELTDEYVIWDDAWMRFPL